MDAAQMNVPAMADVTARKRENSVPVANPAVHQQRSGGVEGRANAVLGATGVKSRRVEPKTLNGNAPARAGKQAEPVSSPARSTN